MYLQSDPHTLDGTHLREFLTAQVENSNRYLADTEHPRQEDMDIAQIEDPQQQSEQRWQRYINMLHGDIDIISSMMLQLSQLHTLPATKHLLE